MSHNPWTTERVTRSKARLNSSHLNQEPEPDSDSDSGSDSDSDLNNEVSQCRTNSNRLQQPNVYVLKNLMKVKMEVDYNPIVRVKQEDDFRVEMDLEGDGEESEKKVQNIPTNLKHFEKTGLDEKNLSPELDSNTNTDTDSESESKSDSNSDDNFSPGYAANSQLSVEDSQNLTNVKMEEDCNPVIGVKQEVEVNNAIDRNGDEIEDEEGGEIGVPSPSQQHVDDFPTGRKRRRLTGDNTSPTIPMESVSEPPQEMPAAHRLGQQIAQTEKGASPKKYFPQLQDDSEDPSEQIEDTVIDATAQVQDFPSPIEDAIFSSESLVTLNYADLVLIIREGRERGEISEEVLCEAAVNWLKHHANNKIKGPKTKKLVSEFPRKEQKGRIIRTLFKIPDSEQNLQGVAFDLLMELYLSKNDEKDGAEQESLSTAPEKTLQNASSIYQRHFVRISLSPAEILMAETFQGKTEPFGPFHSISELVDKLENCDQNREIWLKITKLEVESYDVIMFLTKFANVIRSLNLGRGSLDKMSPSAFQDMLCGLSNLTNLTLAEGPSNWEGLKDGLPHKWNLALQLPHLHTLSLGRSYSEARFYPALFIGLFRIMPNLKNVHGFPLEKLDILEPKGNRQHFAKIKSFDVFNTYHVCQKVERELSVLATMSKNKKDTLQMVHVRLKFLPDQHSQGVLKKCCIGLSRILRNNRNTIESLKIEPLAFPEILEYPKMMAVKKLWFFYVKSSTIKKKHEFKIPGKFFAEGFNARKTFPNLTEVLLEGKKVPLGLFLTLFPEDSFTTPNYFGGATSLTLNLYFKHEDGGVDLEKLATLFPNVTRFSFMDMQVPWLTTSLPQIFRLWPKLFSLKLNLVGRRPVEDSTEPWTQKYLFDSAFTGIPAAKCNELREQKEKMDIDLETEREHPGISSMTELKELVLIFQGPFGPPIISHVTSFYGFQCLPDLKVTCAVPWNEPGKNEIREMLKPIEEHVTFNYCF